MSEVEEKKESGSEASDDAAAAEAAAASEPEPEQNPEQECGQQQEHEEPQPEPGQEPEKEAESGAKDDEPPAPPVEPDWKDMYARTLADFDNYRKRTARDREELVKFSTSEVIKDMLSTADNLALALDQAKDKEDPFVKGVRLAYEGFLKALKDHGAEPFESVGEELDPNRHEAIATLPSDTVDDGKIANEVKKGWMLNGRLLRAAQVVVSSGKAK